MYVMNRVSALSLLLWYVASRCSAKFMGKKQVAEQCFELVEAEG